MFLKLKYWALGLYFHSKTFFNKQVLRKSRGLLKLHTICWIDSWTSFIIFQLQDPTSILNQQML